MEDWIMRAVDLVPAIHIRSERPARDAGGEEGALVGGGMGAEEVLGVEVVRV